MTTHSSFDRQLSIQEKPGFGLALGGVQPAEAGLVRSEVGPASKRRRFVRSGSGAKRPSRTRVTVFYTGRVAHRSLACGSSGERRRAVPSE
jgi:hypothetical protein